MNRFCKKSLPHLIFFPRSAAILSSLANRHQSLTRKQLQQAHCQILLSYPQTDQSAIKNFFSLCIRSGQLDYTLQFIRNSTSSYNLWNCIIKAVAELGLEEDILYCYVKMLREDIRPHNSIISLVLRTCTIFLKEGSGRAIHCHILKMGLGLDAFLLTGLLDFYAKNGDLHFAERVFEEMPERDVVAHNSILAAYSRYGRVETARAMFDEMPEKNTVSWNTMIYCYWRCGDVSEARNLFECAPVKDIATWNSMIAGYCRCGDLSSALELFERMCTKNTISCVHCRDFGMALVLFNRMQSENAKASEVTMISLLSACAHLGALDLGRWIHTYIKKEKLKINVILGTALIDMYMKCGSINTAMQIFHRLHKRNIFCWNAVISGLSMNGLGREAIDVFLEMEKENVCPDNVTFVGILSGCSHSGLVDQGLQFFNQMQKTYGVEPTIEHYGCMVDLLTRAGLLDRAQVLVESMPFPPNAVILVCLLRACHSHKNHQFSDKLIDQMMKLDPNDGGYYVLFSNLLASMNRWTEVEIVRERMRERGVRKTAGCSSIELNNVIHEFIVGDSSHPEFGSISKFLDQITSELRRLGYKSDTHPVLHDIDEEEKENAVRYHSEKVAVAYGIMNTMPGSLVRVVKNLRICSDCHASIKLIAKMFCRKIIVRDRSRFHHFSEDGSCSCWDYW